MQLSQAILKHLDWIKTHFPDALLRLKDKDGGTPQSTVQLGQANLKHLDWIKTHFPDALLRLKDNSGVTPNCTKQSD